MSRSRRTRTRPRPVPAALLALGGLCAAGVAAAPAGERPPAAAPPAAGAAAEARFPSILVVTIDTLRADRLSAYGYARPTSPHIDALLASGARFAEARTVEPLTGPAMASMWTSVLPHEHGATRNGLSIRPGLASLPRILSRRGYRVAAFVGNWTLRDKLSGLDEHFPLYETVLTRKRWFGLTRGEATAVDISDAALDWLESDREARAGRPFLLWVHYVEPHAPYRLQEEFVERLGISSTEPSRSDRYDTEIAFVDAEVGRLLAGVARHAARDELLVVFVADHGESLGEHGDFGHGRTLFEPALRVPLGIVRPGSIAPQLVPGVASLLDLGPTLLGLLGLPPHPGFRGADWSRRLRDPGAAAPAPAAPVARCVQAHKGAVQSVQDRDRARRAGLLEVGHLDGQGGKEIWRARDGASVVYDLGRDPVELDARAGAASPALAVCLEEVRRGLELADALPPPAVDEETLEGLRALGYID